MGCCYSTNNRDSSSSSPNSNKLGSNHQSFNNSKGLTHESRAPPEEETVKEVLSETPKLKPKQEPVIGATTTDIKQDVVAVVEEEEEFKNGDTQKPVFVKIQETEMGMEKKKQQKQLNTIEETMSEVSEICSVSLSETVSTVTIRDNDEVEQEVSMMKRQRIARSPARLQQQSRTRDFGGRVVSQSPTRRISEQSPGKRNYNNGGSLGGGSTMRSSVRDEPGRRRGPAGRDPGESSGRRSRSPATTRSAMGRSPSAKRTNRSPGRVRSDQVEGTDMNNGRKVEGNCNWPSSINSSNHQNNNSSSRTTNESIENPLVSLECFIFL